MAMEYTKKIETTHYLELNDQGMQTLKSMLFSYYREVGVKLPSIPPDQVEMLTELGVIKQDWSR